MLDGPWPIVILIAIVAVYVYAKVRFYMQRSDEQWRDVDKSKLRDWDEDGWDDER